MRPKALDLFCGAGGASKGLHDAGFDVTGVDIKPQPNYPFAFHQADALTFPLEGYDFIWASPPCQDYSALKLFAGHLRGKLIPEVRTRLTATGVPFVIENVVGSELVNPIVLCGSMFGLGVWRHRLFECSPPILMVPICQHPEVRGPVDVTGLGGPIAERKKNTGGNPRKPKNLEHARAVMGINWMTRPELSQAIPPAYSEFIGRIAIAAMRIETALAD